MVMLTVGSKMQVDPTRAGPEAVTWGSIGRGEGKVLLAGSTGQFRRRKTAQGQVHKMPHLMFISSFRAIVRNWAKVTVVEVKGGKGAKNAEIRLQKSDSWEVISSYVITILRRMAKMLCSVGCNQPAYVLVCREFCYSGLNKCVFKHNNFSSMVTSMCVRVSWEV